MENIIVETLKNIFGFLQIDPDTEIENPEEGVFIVRIEGDNLNYLIGFRGQSLDALQNIIRLIVFNKTGQQSMLTVDINGYRERKADKLKDLARNFIDKVRFFEKDVELPRMNAWERRHIHIFVTDYDDILSESTGEGRDRRVVLKLKK